MNGLPEVPEPERGVLGGGDDQPGRGVGRGVGQLLVVPGQLLQQLTRLRVPDAGQFVPT